LADAGTAASVLFPTEFACAGDPTSQPNGMARAAWQRRRWAWGIRQRFLKGPVAWDPFFAAVPHQACGGDPRGLRFV